VPTDFENLVKAFRDPSITELVINPDGTVYIESKSEFQKLPITAGAEDVKAFLTSVVGQDENIGAERPYADLSAQDGSRVHVIGPPLTKGGLCVTIRKRPERRPTLDELIANGTLPQGAATFLKFACQQRKNMLIVGGTSCGKTSMLNALASLIDDKERIIILEDTPEITLAQPHVLYLRTRTRDPRGQADVTLRDLLVNTLRMRPDRILIGECRSTEAADMLEAMNVGHEGMLVTLHANSSREALQRLETLVLLSGISLPLKAVRSNIVLAVDLIVFMARMADGSRRVAQITEITGMDVETITLSDLFILDSRKGPGAAGPAVLKHTGAIPRFFDQLRQQGVEVPLDCFKQV
jgi:pilus assembly protein CpaF